MDTGLARYEAFLAKIERSRKRIVVIGDYLHDIYLEGRLVRTVREERAPVFETLRTWEVPGGAANIAEQLVPWNVEVHTTLVGGTHRVQRFLADGRLFMVESLDGEHRPACKSFEEYFDVCKFNGYADAIVVADYGKGAITPRLAAEIVEVAKWNDIPLIVSPSPAPDEDRDRRWDGATVVKMNRRQWEVRGEEARRWIEDHNVNALVVTQGGLSPAITSRNQCDDAEFQPNRPCLRPVIDTAGAGEHFAAVLTVGVVHGLAVTEAAEFAHEASKLRVAHRRPRPILPAEVCGEFELSLAKILSAENVATVPH